MSKNEKNICQGSFSGYINNPIHKSRLENFIKRNKKTESAEKITSKSKSPVYSGKYAKENFRRNYFKVNDLDQKQILLVNKEAELNEKEKQLAELGQRLFLSKNGADLNSLSDLDEFQENFDIPATDYYEKNKLISEKIETLIKAEKNLDNLLIKYKIDEIRLSDQEKSFLSKIKSLKQNFALIEKKLIKSLCEEILYGIITSAVFQCIEKDKVLLESRFNALTLAIDKINRCENRTDEIKRNLEREALKFLSRKTEASTKADTIQGKAENLETIAKNMEKLDKNTLKAEENFKKREEALQSKMKKIEALEKEIEQQTLPEKKRSGYTPEKKRSDSLHSTKENSLKIRESELNTRVKILDEKKKQIEEYKSKIRWRLNNIQVLEKKSEKFKCATEVKIQDFNNYINSENFNIENRKQKIKNHEASTNLLKNKVQELEALIKEKESLIKLKEEQTCEQDSDSVEEFIRIERSEEVNSDLADFAKSFQARQLKRKKEYEEIAKEKKLISDKINSILNLH